MNLVDWFFSLPIPNALGLVAMVGLIIGCLVVIATDAAVKAVVQHRIAGADEFADNDDVFATIASAVAPRISRYNDEVIVMSDDEFRQIDMKSFTCTTCNVSHLCKFAFDLYNTDGYCLDNK